MKVLWIVMGVPRSVNSLFGRDVAEVKGSWIDGLAKAVSDQHLDLQLTVLCFAMESIDVRAGNVHYISIPCNRWHISKCSARADIENHVRETVRKIAPDLIHIHGTEQVGGSLTESAYCGIPVVVSIQGVLSQCYQAYTGGIPVFELLRSELNLRNLIKCSSIYKEQMLWGKNRAQQEQFIFKRFKYFIGRTEFDRHCLECYNPKAYYFQGEEALNDAFRKVKWSRSKARPHTIFCGNAIGYGLKGGHWLIKAVALLKSEFPDIQLRIAASEDKLKKRRSFYEWIKANTYEIYIRRLIRKLQCENNVIGLSALTPEQVADELATVELFVLPSVCENSPNTLCEAMMVGTPAIATFVGGIPSIMRPDVEGRLVQACDPHVLAGEIRKFFNDHEYAESCVDAARRRALVRHDDENNARVLFKTYQQILEIEKRTDIR